MNVIRYHPDGIVYVRNSGKEYAAKPMEFSDDVAVAGIKNPLGLRSGYWQYLMEAGGGFSKIEPNGCHGPVDGTAWPEAADAIKAIDALIAAKNARDGAGK